MQTHTMVLWSTPSNLDPDSCKQQAYSLLTTLKTFGPELSPKYITSRKKATAQEFGFTLADLEQLLRKGANREGDYTFPELGCRVSFFSSLKEEDSAAISLTIGVSDLRFKNTFVVRFPQSYDLGNAQLRNRTVELFRRCCEVFRPFWGCIQNDQVAAILPSLWESSQPTSIHWVNWFGTSLVDKLGLSKLEHAPVFRLDKCQAGYLLVAKELPIDVNKFSDMQLVGAINRYFGFLG